MLLDLSGAAKPEFVAHANEEVHKIEIQPDGKVIIAGDFTEVNGILRDRIARLNPDGTLDPSFLPDGGPDDVVNAVDVQSDGKIIIGGSFFFVGFDIAPNLARFNHDGSLDRTFLPDINGNSIQDVLVQRDGKVLIAGGFKEVNGAPRRNMARLNEDGSLDTSFDAALDLSFSIDASAAFRLLLDSGDDIFVCGFFNTANNVHRARVARLNGSPKLAALPPAISTPDQTVRVGSLVTLAYPGVETLGPARFQWLHRPGDQAGPATNIVGGTNHFLHYKNFTSKNAGEYFCQVTLPGSTSSSLPINVWPNPAAWKSGLPDLSSFNDVGINGVVRAVLRLPDGRLMIGGSFSRMTSPPGDVTGVLRLLPNGEVDPTFALEAGFKGSVRAMGIQSDGRILIGGAFSLTEGTHECLVRLDANGRIDPLFKTTFENTSEVWALAVESSDDIVVAGSFKRVSELSRPNIALLSRDGIVNTGFNPDEPNGVVRAVALDQSHRVFIGGNFSRIKSTVRNGFARLNLKDGRLDEAFDPFATNQGLVNALFRQKDGSVIAAGQFSRAGDASQVGAAIVSDEGVIKKIFLVSDGNSPGEVFSISEDQQGRIILGGRFTSVGFNVDGIAKQMKRHTIARFQQDGALDFGFDPEAGFEGVGLDALPLAMTEEPSGHFIVVGGFTSVGGLPRSGITRLIGTNGPASLSDLPPAFRSTPADRSVIEQTPLAARNLVVDDLDTPADGLTFSIDPGAPDGLAINPKSGQISWTPTEAQGPSTNRVTIRVQDNSVPALEVAHVISIRVSESNSAPELPVLPTHQTRVSQAIKLNFAASDSDIPSNALRYWFGQGAPPNANLDSRSGLFTWTPGAEQVGAHQIQIVVTDGVQPLTPVSYTYTIVVEKPEALPPFLRFSAVSDTTLLLNLQGSFEGIFVIESSSDLVQWQEVASYTSATVANFVIDLVDPTASVRFFRARRQ